MTNSKKIKMVKLYYNRKSNGSMDCMVVECKTGKILIESANEWIVKEKVSELGLNVVESIYN